MKNRKIAGGGGVQLHVVETGNPAGSSDRLHPRDIAVLAPVESAVGLEPGRGPSTGRAGSARSWSLGQAARRLRRLEAVGRRRQRGRSRRSTSIIRCSAAGPTVRLSSSTTSGTTARTRIGGLHFVGAVTKLGSEAGDVGPHAGVPQPRPAVLRHGRGDERPRSGGLAAPVFRPGTLASELYLMLGYNVSVPPYVRQGLLSRSFDNDDLLPKIRKPVLITHGAADAIVKRAAVEQHKAAMPHAQVQLMANAGHAAFWDDAAGFNERLRGFCERL